MLLGKGWHWLAGSCHMTCSADAPFCKVNIFSFRCGADAPWKKEHGALHAHRHCAALYLNVLAVHLHLIKLTCARTEAECERSLILATYPVQNASIWDDTTLRKLHFMADYTLYWASTPNIVHNLRPSNCLAVHVKYSEASPASFFYSMSPVYINKFVGRLPNFGCHKQTSTVHCSNWRETDNLSATASLLLVFAHKSRSWFA